MIPNLRLAARLLALVVALLGGLALHGVWRLFRRRSPWPRRFLGLVAGIVGARVRVVGTPLATDFETGFALVQALGRVRDIKVAPLGESEALGDASACVLAAATPISETVTDVHYCVYWTMPWLAPLRPAAWWMARDFLRQDRDVAARLMGNPAPPPPVELRCDRPFMFMIRDGMSGAILFMGRLVDPAGEGPTIWFQPVPEGKTVKNRFHFDIFVADRSAPMAEIIATVDAKVAELVALGATVDHVNRVDTDTLQRYGVVMRDPEGNEFCVA